MTHLHEALPLTSNARPAVVTKTFQGRLKFLTVLLLLLAAWCILSPARAFASSGNPNPQVLPPNSHPYGHTYGVWSNLWWQWALSIPANINPGLDTTGADCSVNQSGPVWFLAGSFAGGTITRACTVPAGKALFFPIVNFADVGANSDCTVSNDTVATLRDAVNADIAAQDPTTFTATVDGVNIVDLGAYRAGPNNPSFTVTNLSLLGCNTGISYLAVSDGFYLMLAPLSAGAHTIHFVARSQDITYNLTVAG